MGRKIVVFLLLAASLSLVYSSFAYYLMASRASQQFMGLGVYSSSGNLRGYLPGADLPVPLNQTIHWHLNVSNMIGTVQFARIIVRLGNLSSATPSVNASSDSPILLVTDRFVANENSEVIGFDWTILSTARQPDGSIALKLSLNGGGPVSPSISSPFARDFRLVFELWTYDLSTSSFQYGWKGTGPRVGTWLQVWFNSVPS